MRERLSPDGGWIASGTSEGSVSVQSADLGTERWRVPQAHHGAVRVLAWSPDAGAVASGGDDALINVWEGTTGEVLARYTGHTGPIAALDWSADGRWITSAEETGGLHIWPLHRILPSKGNAF